MYWVYILTNKHNTVFYIGITNDLKRRFFEHKNKLAVGFTSKYNLEKLVYFAQFNDPEEAISYEKKLKGWLRSKKIDLIKSFNPNWDDLSSHL